MSTSAKQPARIIVVLKLPEDHTPLFILRARAIVEAMTGNSWFPAPAPALSVVKAAIDDLSDAETATLTGSAGLVSARDEKRIFLKSLLEQLRAYVEAIATANPEHAAAIIESASMYLKRARGAGGRIFSVTRGSVSGEVHVSAPKAGDRAGYEFQYSLDGGLTWLGLPEPFTTKASATIRGLKPGSRVHVRYRATVKGVTGDWSDPIAIIVD